MTITLGRAHRENAEDALACDHLDVKFNVGSATMQLENLFGGDSELGMYKAKHQNLDKYNSPLVVPPHRQLFYRQAV